MPNFKKSLLINAVMFIGCFSMILLSGLFYLISKDIGQLYEDWEFLKRILESDDEAISYSLIGLSTLFRYIGQTYAA